MTRDDILFNIHFALRHKLRPRVAWRDKLQSRIAAQAILDHLALCGYEITQREPAVLHATPET